MLTAAMADLFVYGTLMDDALVAELTNHRFPKEPATLSGYRKLTPPGGYPQIIPDADEVVTGFLLRGLDAGALRALDRYEDEGQLYRRVEVVVSVAGVAARAMTYVGIAD